MRAGGWIRVFFFCLEEKDNCKCQNTIWQTNSKPGVSICQLLLSPSSYEYHYVGNSLLKEKERFFLFVCFV